MKKFLFFLLLAACNQFIFAQTKATKPKLVVGIVVDQMRYDYLYRYASKYGKGGFQRLMNEGHNCKNNHYHYASTVTGAGHAAVYTGSIPAANGIVGNEWYDRFTEKVMYVTEDTTVSTVGSNTKKAGEMSPKNMLATTITDQLRLASNFKSKVVGISIKDRGAILPAGHTGNAAYWYDSKSGNFITSTFYMTDLPQWVKDYNALSRTGQFIAQGWNTLLPIEKYTESEEDQQPYEYELPGEKTSTFPHALTTNEAVLTSPYGNTLVKEMGLRALQSERLGMGNETDFLCLSFSSPDYVGHSFGTHAVEIEDTYLRLDKEIEDLLNNLDKQLGKNNYLVFLTADHGVADIAAFSRKHNIPAGTYESGKRKLAINGQIESVLGEGKWVKNFQNYQIYLNHSFLKEKNISVAQVYEAVKQTNFVAGSPVYQIVNFHDFESAILPDAYKSMIKNTYNPKRSGDILLVYEPAFYLGYGKGTTHGTMWNYDTHVPLLFYGWNVNKGETIIETHISDIAPTIAQFLNILEPNACVGKTIPSVFSIKK